MWVASHWHTDTPSTLSTHYGPCLGTATNGSHRSDRILPPQGAHGLPGEREGYGHCDGGKLEVVKCRGTRPLLPPGMASQHAEIQRIPWGTVSSQGKHFSTLPGHQKHLQALNKIPGPDREQLHQDHRGWARSISVILKLSQLAVLCTQG